MIKVSVIVPIYNVEKYLVQCLDSILNQSLKEIEIICVNDGSTDSSGDIAQAYSKKDHRVIVINKENAGYGHTMNGGIEKAKGEYIGIVESDDFIHPNMYETLYEKAKTNNLDVIKANYVGLLSDSENDYFFNQELMTEKRWYDRVIVPYQEFDDMSIHFATWSGIYKKEFLMEHQIRHNETPGASFQDVGFATITTLMAERLMYIDDYFYRYRMDNENSSVKSKEKVYCVFEEYKWIENYLKNYEAIYKRYESTIRYRCIYNYIFELERVEKRHIPELILYMSKYVQETKRINGNNRSFFNGSQQQLIDLISDDPESAVEIVLDKKEKKEEFYRQNKLVQDAMEIVIYGAGVVGTAVFRSLIQQGVSEKVSCFAVTEGTDLGIMYEKRVTLINECANKDSLVIIAVSMKKSKEAACEMEEYAKSLGFKNIVKENQALWNDTIS